MTEGIVKERVRGIGFDATCSLVVLDQNFQPVAVNKDGRQLTGPGAGDMSLDVMETRDHVSLCRLRTRVLGPPSPRMPIILQLTVFNAKIKIAACLRSKVFLQLHILDIKDLFFFLFNK